MQFLVIVSVAVQVEDESKGSMVPWRNSRSPLCGFVASWGEAG